MVYLHWSLIVTAVAGFLLFALILVAIGYLFRSTDAGCDIHRSRDGYEYKIVDL